MCDAGLASTGITFISSHVKIGQLVQKLKGDTHSNEHKHTHSTVISYAYYLFL
jgi:hypothetical protein